MRAIRVAVGVPRVYVVMFGEGAQHLHAHLIPRDPGRAGTSAWEIADWYRAVESGQRESATDLDIARIITRVRDEMPSVITS